MEANAESRHLHEVMTHFETAMLITRRGEELHARPMQIAEVSPGGDCLFATSIESPKIAEIERDPEAMLTFHGTARYAAVRGRAEVIRDAALIDRLWRESWKIWFPKGKADPELVILRVDVRDGEYWDSSGSRGLKRLIQAAGAYAAGRKPPVEPDQHAKVRL